MPCTQGEPNLKRTTDPNADPAERAAYRVRRKRTRVRCDGCGKSILVGETQCPFCHMRQGDCWEDDDAE
ncbi:unnamed protein product [marine sediment metagenome]|uniref:Uncharacterized protein n=1 Tax=marine sediment metagenome TaxID=412755 RepID=X0Y7U9_9ZZZZ